MTRTFSLAELQATFTRYAAIHGHEQATDTLERATGTRHLHAVSKDKTAAAMMALVGGRCIFDGMFAPKGPRVRGRSQWLA
jgi:hypothetical protein